METNKQHTVIDILPNGEIHQRQNNATQRAKVEKIGGLNKANKAVKARQKIEATENQICFRMDRATNQRNKRRAKR